MNKRIPFAAVLAITLGLGAANAAKITVWSDFDALEGDWLVEATKRFTATPEGRGNTVEVVRVPIGENRDKFIQGKGDSADLIVTIPHDQIGQFVTAGAIEPMDKYLTPAMKADLPKSATDAFSYQGKLFGLPMFGEAVAVVYNKKLLPGGIPKTWPEFISTAQKLTNLEKQQFGFLAEIENQYNMHGLYRAFGGYVFGTKNGQLDPTDIGLNNAGSLRAARLINDLRYKYNLIPEGAADGGLIKDLFTKGQLAMWQTGPWSMADVKKAGIDYGIGLLPRPTGAIRDWAPFVGIRGVVMNAYSRNKDVAAKLAQFLVTPANQVSLNKAGGRVPVSKSAARQLASDPVAAGFSRAIAAGIPMPNIPAMGQVWTPWGNAVTLAAKTPNITAAQIKEQHDKAVAEIKAATK